MNDLNRSPHIFESDTVTLLVTALFFAYFSPSALGALIVLCALSYMLVKVIALAFRSKPHVQRLSADLLLAIIGVAITILVIIPTTLLTIQRARTTPAAASQDSLLQIEAAARFILAGKNPYVEDYLSTPMADWDFPKSGPQPAPQLYHLV